MRKAIIDIGTNSVRLLIAEKNETWDKLWADIDITKIGENIGTEQMIKEEPLKRTVDAVKRFVRKAEGYQCDQILLVATSAVRDARNREHVCESLQAACGIEVVVLSGEEEATLSYQGAVGNSGESVAVLDIGGGSTELVYPLAGGLNRNSIAMGSLRLSERQDLQEHMHEILLNLKPTWLDGECRLIAVGGTVTALAAMDQELDVYDAVKVQGHEMTIEKVRQWQERLMGMSLQQRKQLKGLQAKRADHIPYGAWILAEAMDILNVNVVTISDRDLLYALLDA